MQTNQKANDDSDTEGTSAVVSTFHPVPATENHDCFGFQTRFSAQLRHGLSPTRKLTAAEIKDWAGAPMVVEVGKLERAASLLYLSFKYSF